VADDAPVTIYMPLADLSDWLPVKAIRQREDIYCILGPMAEGAQWKFPPGTMVRRTAKVLPTGRREMVAAELDQS